MTTKIVFDDDEIIVDSEKDFYHVVNDFGADGRVWFDRKFIRDYICALYRKIDRLEKSLKAKG